MQRPGHLKTEISNEKNVSIKKHFDRNVSYTGLKKTISLLKKKLLRFIPQNNQFSKRKSVLILV